MRLPAVLVDAQLLWRPTFPLPGGMSCRLTCYQAVVQCQTYWCWAAVLQEIVRCKESKQYSQCELVEGVMKGKDCECESCTPQVMSPCNKPRVLESILKSRLPKGVAYQQLGGLTPKTLCDEFDADDPVVARFVGTEKGAHYAVLSGLSEVNGKKSLEISDPDCGRLASVPLVDFQHVIHDGRSLAKVWFL